MRLLLRLCVAVSCITYTAPSALAQTKAFLSAPVLARDTDLVLTLSNDKKTLLYRKDNNGSLQPLPSDQLLAHNPFRVAYLRYNPLSMKITVNSVDVDDPAQAQIQKLLDALQTVATTIQPAKDAANAKLASTTAVVDQKRSKLIVANAGARGTEEQKKLIVAAESDALAQATRDDDTVRAVNSAIDKANVALKMLKDDSDKWALAIDNAWAPHVTEQQALAAGFAAMKQSEVYLTTAQVALDGQNVPLNKLPSLDATGVRLVNSYDELTKKFKDTIAALQKLEDTLTTLKPSALWDNTGTALLTNPVIDATLDKEKKVTVAISFVAVDQGTYTLKETGVSMSATVTVRRYRALVPEIGVGAVFSIIDRPTYGTGKNAGGATIVAVSSISHVTVAPTVMLNFVCRCDAGGIAPMIQIGAATTPTLPAILLGGGIRLFGTGKGDVAIGGGLTLGWYKDLNTLKVGDVVSGTADINADLAFITAPKPAPYLTIQYKF